MSENNPTPAPATTKKHVVKQGKAYTTLADGTPTRNYVVLGKDRVYVNEPVGKKITKEQAHAHQQAPAKDA